MIPHDYAERTYAGVLGKLIGVYLGRPVESWLYERIMEEVGQINYYINARRSVPLVTTDDDISGTFTFLRALPDHGTRRNLSAREIGDTWLNYIIEQKSILWWGGLGNSTEHTAYLRLKRGIPAPESGSIALNTRTVAEQIGAQIFIDGWAMVAPGDPELAAYLALQAASVSHDGEAIYAAQVIAVMESLAYVETNLNILLDRACEYIPGDSLIRRLIDDVREWHSEFRDWHDARLKIVEYYGYDRYGGNCHIVPNHALIHLALLYGGDDFQKALMIVNTAGWDTDCNSGNVGCLLGIKNGLEGIDSGPDWRSPLADRLYLPTADGGSCITDAVAQTDLIVNLGRLLAGLSSITPKGGARFHFELPGSVQGFSASAGDLLTIENTAGHSTTGTRSLALRYRGLTPGRGASASTFTFIPQEAIRLRSYDLHASPTLYPGQTVRAAFMTDEANSVPVECRLLLHYYGANDQLVALPGPAVRLAAGTAAQPEWRIPDTGGAPIALIGLAIESIGGRADGTVYLDWLTWDGEPEVNFIRPSDGGTIWRRAWVPAIDLSWDKYWSEAYRLLHNEGTGLLIQGTRGWRDYTVRAVIIPHMAKAFGVAARVQGLRRGYRLILTNEGTARLIRAYDGDTVLASADFAWEQENAYAFELSVRGSRLVAKIDGRTLFDLDDTGTALFDGAVAFVCEEGCVSSESLAVSGSRS